MNKIKIERNNNKKKKETKISHHYTDKTRSYWFKYLSKKKKKKKMKVNFISVRAYTYIPECEINFTSVALIKRTLPLTPFPPLE